MNRVPTGPVRIVAVVGARPNFMKVAPVLRAMADRSRFDPILVHTGQHYDAALSDTFFEELGMPSPDVHLGVGSASHAAQTARILEGFAPVLEANRPDLVLVAGDVNSTLACALAAVKLSVPVAHIEAGLRSGDRTMPEEINRVLTDSISDLLFTTSAEARSNLEREGADASTIHFVGNSMIDTLRRFEDKARDRPIVRERGLTAGRYALVTLHRPSNVDSGRDMERVLQLLTLLVERMPVAFPIHPRTRANLEAAGKLVALEAIPELRLLPPLGYLDFLALMMHASVVVTDSGGVQEETTALGVDCLTLRPNTERPVTVTEGTNLLVNDDPRALLRALDDSRTRPRHARLPEKWDGQAGARIAAVIRDWFERGAPSRVRAGELRTAPGPESTSAGN